LEEKQARADAAREAAVRRHLDASRRIIEHGILPLAFLPQVTTEMLEAFADELDRRSEALAVANRKPKRA
jgi:hypothetical protein